MHRKSNTAPFLWGAVKYDFARDSKKFIILPVEIINLVHIDPFTIIADRMEINIFKGIFTV